MSKMIKLLVLVAVIALPCVLLAQETPVAPETPGTPVGEKPYANGDAIKDWANVKADFDLGGTEISISGFTVKRTVTAEPEGQFYYKENNTYWTWKEAYAVTAPAEGKDLGYFTYRAPKPAPPAPVTQGKIYKATAPAAPAATPAAPKTGWKRGEESVRSK